MTYYEYVYWAGVVFLIMLGLMAKLFQLAR